MAAKAGYSKWHLQRMFKDITGNAIGAYIRARRLSKAAVALRLTSRPILDIALQYRFDSQQTFTRAFKKQFAQTPALYRRAEDWNAFGICPPIRLGAFTLPQPEFVSLPDKHLVGLTQSYSCTLEQITTVRTELRSQFWRQFLGDVETLPPVLYGLHHSRPSQEKDDEQEVLYTTALEPDQVPDKVQEGQPLVLPGGEFAMFSYEDRGTARLYSDGLRHLPAGAPADAPQRARHRTLLSERRAPSASGAYRDQVRLPDPDSALTLQFVQRGHVQMRDIARRFHDPAGSQPRALLVIDARQ